MSLNNPPPAFVPFKPGDIIKEHYTLVQQIGAGSYGAIFEAFYQNGALSKVVAMKFEQITFDKPMLYNEIVILKALAGQKHYARFYQYGTHERYKFITMELLGPCLIDLINRKVPYRFDLRSILKFGVQAIEALQALHKAGFVHRDIKPSNFVIGGTLETSSKVYLIDFGLCKKLFMKDGIVQMPSMKGSFRGTVRYASTNAHLNRELGRQDDLMSLIYIFVEFYTGTLPWDEVMRIKEFYQGGNLLLKMPPEFMEFEYHILSLEYTTEPDYQFLTSLLYKIAKNNQMDLNAPFDWEIEMKLMRDLKKQEKQEEMNKIQEQQEQKHKMFLSTPKATKDQLNTLTSTATENPNQQNDTNSTQKQAESFQPDQNINTIQLIKLIKQKNKEFYEQQHNLKIQQQQQQKQQLLLQQQQQHNYQKQQPSNLFKSLQAQMGLSQIHKSITMNQINSKSNSYKAFPNENYKNIQNVDISNNIEINNNNNNNIYIIPPHINSQQNTNKKQTDEKSNNQIEQQNESVNNNQISQIIKQPENNHNINNNENDQKKNISSPILTNSHQIAESSVNIQQGLSPLSLLSTPLKSNQTNLQQSSNEQLTFQQMYNQTHQTDQNDNNNNNEYNNDNNNSPNINFLNFAQSPSQQQQQLYKNQNLKPNIVCLSTVNSHSSELTHIIQPSYPLTSINQITIQLQQQLLPYQQQEYSSEEKPLPSEEKIFLSEEKQIPSEVKQLSSQEKPLKKKKAKHVNKQKTQDNEIQIKEKKELENNQQKQEQLLKKQFISEPQPQQIKVKSEDDSNNQQQKNINNSIIKRKSLVRRKTFNSLPLNQNNKDNDDQANDNINIIFNDGQQILQLIPADPKNQSLGDMKDNLIFQIDSNLSNYSNYSIKDAPRHEIENPSIMTQRSDYTNNQSCDSFIRFRSPIGNRNIRPRGGTSSSQLPSFRSQSVDSKDLIQGKEILDDDSNKDLLFKCLSGIDLNDKELIENTIQLLNVNNRTSSRHSLHSQQHSGQFSPESQSSDSQKSLKYFLVQSNLSPMTQQLKKQHSLQNENPNTSNLDNPLQTQQQSYDGLSQDIFSNFQLSNDKTEDGKQKFNSNADNSGFGYRVRSMSQSRQSFIGEITDNADLNVKSIMNDNNEQIGNINQIKVESSNNNFNTNNSVNWEHWVDIIGGSAENEEHGSEQPKKLTAKKQIKGKTNKKKDQQQSNNKLYENSQKINQDNKSNNNKTDQKNSNIQQIQDNLHKFQQLESPIYSPISSPFESLHQTQSQHSLKEKNNNLIFNAICTPSKETGNILIVPYSPTYSDQINQNHQFNEGMLNYKDKTNNVNNIIKNKEKDIKKDKIKKQDNYSLTKNLSQIQIAGSPVPVQSPGISMTIRNTNNEQFGIKDIQQEKIFPELLPNQVNQEVLDNNLNNLIEDKECEQNENKLQTNVPNISSQSNFQIQANQTLNNQQTFNSQICNISPVIIHTQSLTSNQSIVSPKNQNMSQLRISSFEQLEDINQRQNPLYQQDSQQSSQSSLVQFTDTSFVSPKNRNMSQLRISSFDQLANIKQSQNSIQESENQSSSNNSLIHVNSQSVILTSPMNENQTNYSLPTHYQTFIPNSSKHKTSIKYQSQKGGNVSNTNSDGIITSPNHKQALQQKNQKSPLSQSDAWKSDADEQDTSQQQEYQIHNDNNNQLQQLSEQRDLITQHQKITKNQNDSPQLLQIEQQKVDDNQQHQSDNNQQQINANISTDDLHNTSGCCYIL